VTVFQSVNRPDLAILDALDRCVDPITLKAIDSHVCPHERWTSFDDLSKNVRALVADGMITSSFHPGGGGVPVYAITMKGRNYLSAAERLDPIGVTVCNRREPEVPDAAIATICIDEDELNNWWDGLEVEAKADAFTRYALDTEGRDSRVYIEPCAAVSVPVVGTVGDTAAENKAEAERMQKRVQERIDEIMQPAKNEVPVNRRSLTDAEFKKLILKHSAVIAKAVREELANA
jgi:DNA-binding MarR family transcriptional regulator